MIYTKEVFKQNYNLTLNQLTITPPLPKTSYVEIPGTNEPLDLTEYFGEIFYYNQTITIRLETLDKREVFLANAQRLLGDINGRKIAFKRFETDEAYYTGRASANIELYNFGVQAVVLTISASPYRQKEKTTIKKVGSGTIKLTNWQRKARVKVTTTKSTSIEFNNNTYTFGIGSFTSDIVLDAGENMMEVSTIGTTTFEYVEMGF